MLNRSVIIQCRRVFGLRVTSTANQTPDTTYIYIKLTFEQITQELPAPASTNCFKPFTHSSKFACSRTPYIHLTT